MNTINKKELYPKICEWLGRNCIINEVHLLSGETDYTFFSGGIFIDFLHDANQREWIKDKLKEDGWIIVTTEDKIECSITLYTTHGDIYCKSNKSRPLALLHAVMELIEKENEDKENKS